MLSSFLRSILRAACLSQFALFIHLFVFLSRLLCFYTKSRNYGCWDHMKDCGIQIHVVKEAVVNVCCAPTKWFRVPRPSLWQPLTSLKQERQGNETSALILKWMCGIYSTLHDWFLEIMSSPGNKTCLLCMFYWVQWSYPKRSSSTHKGCSFSRYQKRKESVDSVFQTTALS